MKSSDTSHRYVQCTCKNKDWISILKLGLSLGPMNSKLYVFRWVININLLENKKYIDWFYMQIELITKLGIVYGQLLYIKECYQVRTAMRILERLGIQTTSSFVKFDTYVCIGESKANFSYSWRLYDLVFLSRNYFS